MRWLVPLFVCAAACHPTEALLVVSTDKLSVPADFDQLQLTIGNGLFDGPLPICRDDQPAGDCHPFPLRVLLVPGKSTDETVEVKLVGRRKGQDVLGSAARFRFTPDRTLRLDVILYADCLDQLSCLQQDQACVRDGQCADVMPVTYSPSDDLPVPIPALGDLAVAPPDFAGVDFAGCAEQCLPNAQCGVACGQSCGPGCGPLHLCDPLTQQCSACGGAGLPCCPGDVCDARSTCVNGMCQFSCGPAYYPGGVAVPSTNCVDPLPHPPTR